MRALLWLSLRLSAGIETAPMRAWLLIAFIFTTSCAAYHQARWERLASDPANASFVAELTQLSSNARGVTHQSYTSSQTPRGSFHHGLTSAPRSSRPYINAIPVHGAAQLVVSPYAQEGPYIDVSGISPGTPIECPVTGRTLIYTGKASTPQSGLARDNNNKSNSRIAVSSVEDESGAFWMTSSSGVRHNSSCRWFRNSVGTSCSEEAGRACKICGG